MKFTIGDLGAIGWVPDVDGFELPPNAWTDVKNVRFRNGYVENMDGYVQLATGTASTFIPYWLQQYSAASEKYLVQAGLSAVYVSDGDGVATDITGTAPTGTAADRWTGGVQFGVLGVNNGVDVPQYWAGNLANNLATFTGWSANWRCKALRPHKNYWIAMNITKSGTAYPHMVKWSAAADPGAPPASWDETDATLDAGENNLEGQDKLIDGLTVGDQFWLFKERSIHAMSFVGAPLVWRFTRLPGHYGLLARGCAAETPSGAVFLSASDVILHDGQAGRSIADGRVKRWLFDNISPTNYERAFVAANQEKQEVWVCIPTGTGTACTIALIWNWASNTWTKRTLPKTHHAAEVDMDAALDPWDWIDEQGYGGFPTDPVGAFEWAADTDTWDGYDNYLSGANSHFLTCGVGTYEPTKGAVYLVDLGAINVSYDDAGNLNDLSFMKGYVERTGLHFDDDHSRYLVNHLWPRWGGSGITASYIPTGGLTGTESPETASGLSSGVNLTESYVPQKYSGSVSGRYFNLRFDLTAGSPARMKTLVFDLAKQGQH